MIMIGFMTELHCFFKKNALYLSFNVFSMKVLQLGTLFLCLLLEAGMPFFVVIRVT